MCSGRRPRYKIFANIMALVEKYTNVLESVFTHWREVSKKNELKIGLK